MDKMEEIILRLKKRDKDLHKRLDAPGNEIEMIRIFKQLNKEERLIMLKKLRPKNGSVAVLVTQPEESLSIPIRQNILRFALDNFPQQQYHSLVKAMAKGMEGRPDIEHLVNFAISIAPSERKCKLRKILKYHRNRLIS